MGRVRSTFPRNGGPCADPVSGPLHLHGLTNYGDSIEDEWLIVYILRQLSNQFSNLWIKVVDTDGEFLLIEAANALPRWLNPEIADNRVSLCFHIDYNSALIYVRSGYSRIS